MSNDRKTNSPAIIIPAYSRPRSLQRLLACVEAAVFPSHDVRLIISLDGGASEEVAEIAHAFEFTAGNVEVVERQENLGLREHILWCGDQTEIYGSVILLEDDLVVDPWFYFYSSAALGQYGNDSLVAGIALYSPAYNEFVDLPFEPLVADSATYLMQIPCSWGQAWTESQWREFRLWLENSSDTLRAAWRKLPDVISKWPESSWKKLFAAFMVQTEKFFLYPYSSYSSNCSDSGGEHVKRGTNRFQAKLPNPLRQFEAPDFLPSLDIPLRYDPFMEPTGLTLPKSLQIEPSNVQIDFYSSKPVSMLQQTQYCITTRIVDRSVVSFPLRFRPLPINLFYPGFGDKDEPVHLVESKDLQEPSYFGNILTQNRLMSYFAVTPRGGLRYITFFVFEFFRRVLKLLQR